MSERPKGDDDPRRLKRERDALLKLCNAQRRKIERQAAEIQRLRARLKETADE